MKKHKNVDKSRDVDVRPLDQREKKFNTHKGMLKLKQSGFFDKTEYINQELPNFYEEI